MGIVSKSFYALVGVPYIRAIVPPLAGLSPAIVAQAKMSIEPRAPQPPVVGDNTNEGISHLFRVFRRSVVLSDAHCRIASYLSIKAVVARTKCFPMRMYG